MEWTSHRTPAAVSLTHEGIRLMEEQEEREDRATADRARPND
ncbi:hypothetical protein ACWDUC_15465 [Streptomyces tricolor]